MNGLLGDLLLLGHFAPGPHLNPAVWFKCKLLYLLIFHIFIWTVNV